jgi:vacuolar-type H+-ATPase subunit F/Vma7
LSNPVFIGDELTACAFRLGGARIRLADDGGLEKIFADEVANASLILLSAQSAARLAPDTLNSALKKLYPLVVIVPDAQGTSPPDLTRQVRQTLELE